MTVSSMFGDDAYCAVNYGTFVFFVTLKSDEIPSSNDPQEFCNVLNDFHRRFEVNHLKALECYAILKGYEFKDRGDFAIVKIGDNRVVVGLTERRNIKSIKRILA